ncbi:MASE3 domain-containing protein [Neobacillus mesonae]|uniref:MASE3 domain-containing protein n=1 Tax=Neobacillus mesonae TaxID=1193713 RepID=UPI000830EA65|nr:MASE3 domain-containing protein [Neobacillus mesonae]
MKKQLTEGKFLLYSVLAIILLMVFHLNQPQINIFYNHENYVGIHTLLECISISISATIFFYGRKVFRQTKSSRMLLLSITFFLVGAIDLLHTMSFKGMPFFITESSVAKATWFWVTARMLQAFLILLVLLLPDRKLKRDVHNASFIFGMIIVCTIGYTIFQFEQSLPVLMVEGEGTTFVKNVMEYAVSFIQFICLIVTLYQYHEQKCEAKLSIALALVFLLLTELVFTIYQSVYDIDNFTGHILKTLGFYYILKGFYFLGLGEGKDDGLKAFGLKPVEVARMKDEVS